MKALANGLFLFVVIWLSLYGFGAAAGILVRGFYQTSGVCR